MYGIIRTYRGYVTSFRLLGHGLATLARKHCTFVPIEKEEKTIGRVVANMIVLLTILEQQKFHEVIIGYTYYFIICIILSY